MKRRTYATREKLQVVLESLQFAGLGVPPSLLTAAKP